jgi:uncharacterized protein YndB with AHSA1/START domain
MTKGKRRIEMFFEIRASPRVVFRALTNRVTLAKWFSESAEIEPRKGGRYVLKWHDGSRRTGEVLEFRPERSLILTWRQNGEATRAAFWLESSRIGTILRLRQTGLPRDLYRPVNFIDVYSRWVYYLSNLRSVIETGRDLRKPHDRF